MRMHPAPTVAGWPTLHGPKDGRMLATNFTFRGGDIERALRLEIDAA
jgi:hypothetical protein